MKFAYSGFISPAPDTGEEVLIFRPEVPLRIHGPEESALYMALVDTGADNTILPQSIARELKIATTKAKGPGATAFGGQQLALSFADVQLEIVDDTRARRWPARVYFFEFLGGQPETVVVGHEGFLDYFTTIFHGDQLVLDIEPNGEFPQVSPR
jgi:hypothetical protein